MNPKIESRDRIQFEFLGRTKSQTMDWSLCRSEPGEGFELLPITSKVLSCRSPDLKWQTWERRSHADYDSDLYE